MITTVMKGLRLDDTEESFFELGKGHIRVLPLCYIVDLLILKNRVFRLRNVQIWVVLSSIILLIFTNSVFKLQNVQIWTESNCKWVYLLIVMSGILGSKR